MPRHLDLALPALLLTTMGLAQVPDWQRLPGIASMSSRLLDYDLARDRMVMFESSGFGRLSRTWEWVDETWSLRRTGTTPPPRDGFAFAFDPVRRRFVMFGGARTYAPQPGRRLADTWEYDGIDWRQLAPAQSPPAQDGGWMGYDHAQGGLLLCDGANDKGAGGVHRFNGVTWSLIGPLPFTTSGTALASDPLRRRIVAVTYGSWAPGVQTLEWDGFAWTTAPLATQPPPGLGNMTFVQARGRVVLHRALLGPPPYRHELWEYSGTTWQRLPGPVPARVGSTMAHDPARNLTFTFAAGDNDAPHQTWIWDGTRWDVHTDGLGWDVPRFVAFDHNRQQVVAVNNQPLRSMGWDGERWHLGAAPPQALRLSGLAFDRARSRLVAVGRDTSQAWVTWEHDGTNWSVAGAGPAAAEPHALLWHAARNRLMLVTPTGLHDWNGAAWLAVGTGPTWIAYGAVYDAARQEIVVPLPFAGSATAPIWPMQVWDGTSWRTRVPVTSPPLRVNWDCTAIGYDEGRQRVVVFGGRDPTHVRQQTTPYGYLDDLWEWDGNDWSQRVLQTTPPARESAALVYDPVRKHLLLLGGNRHEYNGASRLFSDVWAVDAAAPATVTPLGPGCPGATGTPRLAPSTPHGGAGGFTLDLHGASPAAPVVFALALANASAPLGPACTTFVPAPDQLRLAVANGAGFAATSAAIPLAAMGLSFTAQAAVLDPTAARGFAATDGQRLLVGR